MKFKEGFEFGTTIKDAFFDQNDKSQNEACRFFV